MADSGATREKKSTPGCCDLFKNHAMANKIDVTMWAIRGSALLFTLAYFIPIIGNPYNAYYRVLWANAAVSAIRLQQRLPAFSISKEFLTQLFAEDSCHYLLYSLIFLYATPISLVIVPVVLFCMIHYASYSLTLLDLLGQNSWWGARIAISLIEFQTKNILRLIAFVEIILMPYVVLSLLFGSGGFITPIMYYQFVTLRYSSRRNPHTRNMFRELRNVFEKLANKPFVPQPITAVMLNTVEFICKLAPEIQQEQ